MDKSSPNPRRHSTFNFGTILEPKYPFSSKIGLLSLIKYYIFSQMFITLDISGTGNNPHCNWVNYIRYSLGFLRNPDTQFCYRISHSLEYRMTKINGYKSSPNPWRRHSTFNFGAILEPKYTFSSKIGLLSLKYYIFSQMFITLDISGTGNNTPHCKWVNYIRYSLGF